MSQTRLFAPILHGLILIEESFAELKASLRRHWTRLLSQTVVVCNPFNINNKYSTAWTYAVANVVYDRRRNEKFQSGIPHFPFSRSMLLNNADNDDVS
jgi:phosphoribosyl-dephospho-CoA transferase